MQILGGQAALARAVSTQTKTIHQPNVYKWLNSPNPDQMPPAEYCPAIERATNGEVRCEDLRGDIDWSVLRNSDCRSGGELRPRAPSTFGDFGEPRCGAYRREDGDRRDPGAPFGEFGEPRDGDRRVDERRKSSDDGWQA